MKIISRYKQNPPSEKDWATNNRAISNGPLYAPSEVLALLSSENIQVMTRKAITDTAELGFDLEDIAVLLKQALDHGKYLTSEWTKLNEKTCAACDAYRVTRQEAIDNNRYDVEYYIKFAINNQGALVLIVSCHLSN